MPGAIFIALLIAISLVGALNPLAVRLWNRLFEHAKANHNQPWIEAGSPMYASAWSPPRGSAVVRAFTWIFSTPPWLRSDSEARRLLRRLRILVCTGWGIILLALITAILAARE